jgi:DNA-binding FadR family transcriptional regulator
VLAGNDQEGKLMTEPSLIQVHSVIARIACHRRTGQDLRVLRDSVEQACGLPRGASWERKAIAHAEFHCLLADATGTSAYALLARCISSSVRGMIVAAGPPAEYLIIASRRRLLIYLCARDGDGAAWEMADCLGRLGKMTGPLAAGGLGTADA